MVILTKSSGNFPLDICIKKYVLVLIMAGLLTNVQDVNGKGKLSSNFNKYLKNLIILSEL